MTRTEYREYIASADWQQRRKEFLSQRGFECNRCGIPRWLAQVAYDQDLNVHHRSYSSLGDEDWDDLEPLCRRCHDIESFGRSDLKPVKSATCTCCKQTHWDPYSESCLRCEVLDAQYKECVECGAVRRCDRIDGHPVCDPCYEVLHGNFDRVWNRCDKPLINYPDKQVKDFLLLVLLSKFEVDSILDSLAILEPVAVKHREGQLYRAEQKQSQLTDEDIHP